MTNPNLDAETVLADVRRRLASATTAAEILASGEPLTGLVERIDCAIADIDDEISTEAENLDRSRTIKLRAERLKVGDLLTDAENLSRRVGEKHEAALRAEADASMQALRASGIEKQSEVYALITGLEVHVRSVVDGFCKYQQLVKEIDYIRRQLETAKREDLQLPPLWRSIAQPGDEPGKLFDFLDINERQRHTAAHFFTFADRIRVAIDVKAEAPKPAGGLVSGIRSLAKRAS